MEKTKSVLNDWLNAVNSADVEKLIALYDQSAILTPTFSNRILKSPEERREYFLKLASRENLSISLHENTLAIQELSDNIHILSGIYNWKFKVDGELLNFEARFTYVIDISKRNPIIHHHSSQIPRMI